jgi:hypothetical protein
MATDEIIACISCQSQIILQESKKKEIKINRHGEGKEHK